MLNSAPAQDPKAEVSFLFPQQQSGLLFHKLSLDPVPACFKGWCSALFNRDLVDILIGSIFLKKPHSASYFKKCELNAKMSVLGILKDKKKEMVKNKGQTGLTLTVGKILHKGA